MAVMIQALQPVSVFRTTQPLGLNIIAVDNRHQQPSLFACAWYWHDAHHPNLNAHLDKEAAMVISLLLMALQDAWLNIGKAAAQIPTTQCELPDAEQR